MAGISAKKVNWALSRQLLPGRNRAAAPTQQRCPCCNAITRTSSWNNAVHALSLTTSTRCALRSSMRASPPTSSHTTASSTIAVPNTDKGSTAGHPIPPHRVNADTTIPARTRTAPIDCHERSRPWRTLDRIHNDMHHNGTKGKRNTK